MGSRRTRGWAVVLALAFGLPSFAFAYTASIPGSVPRHGLELERMVPRAPDRAATLEADSTPPMPTVVPVPGARRASHPRPIARLPWDRVTTAPR